MSIGLVAEHLFIVLAASLLSLAIGLPLGVAAYLNAKARPVILRVVDILQTIPSLALLGILMVFFGAGKVTVIVGITLYSLLPIVRNTQLGLQEVDPGVKEAARGMGMSRLYRLVVVELPLALPTILTGVRIAVVNAIGTAVFAAFVGGGGLGGVITRSIRIQNIGLLLQATGALILIAVAADLIMGWFEGQLRRTRRVTKKMWLPVGVVLGAFLVLVPFAGQKPQGLLLYDGDYSETQLMVRMAKLLIEDRTGLEVTIQDQMSQVNNFNALKGDNHSCDLMMSYDGTLLTTFLGLDPTDVPEGESIYSYADSVAEERYGLRLLQPLGFDNTYAIAVTQAAAEKYALSKISDLQPVAGQLVFGAEHEFFTQEGSMKFNPFSEYYGLRFKDVVSVDVSLKYAAAEKGSFDVTEVYTTDGLNRKAGLVVLEDDKNFFPEYNGAFLIREDTLTRFADTAPDLEETLDLLAGKITNEDMVEMTYQVDVQGRSTDEVAKEFLQKQGLLG